jgi:hypothetical protein
VSERWEYMMISWVYSTEEKSVGVHASGAPKSERVWKREFQIFRAGREMETKIDSVTDDPDAKEASFLGLLNEFGAEGWEMITETTPESTIISEQYGWHQVGVPVYYRWLLKRRVEA